MSWFKDNKFVVVLASGTLVGAGLLYYAGARAQSRYDEAQTSFEAAKSEVLQAEKLPLYPKLENRDGKQKALDDYRKSVESLQTAFEGYRPKEVKNISPQELTDKLKAADERTRKAFEEFRTKVPDGYFCGFAAYKTTMASGNSTGILDYQLGAIQNLMLVLAKTGATELKNIHRPALPEEEGKEYKPQETEVARALPVEITFQGPEKALREFCSAITKSDDKYVVIRTIRVINAKKEPPRTSDAKFEKPADKGAGGVFVFPGDDAKPKDDAAPVAASSDSSRILAQILGSEEVQVFMRLDVLQFLPAKKLP